MRILERLERLSVAGALALPEQVQRRLLGRPVVRDGLTLSTEWQWLLWLQRLARIPGAETLPLDRARDVVRRQARLVGGHQSVGSVRDVRVGDLPGRLYTPEHAVSPGPLLVFFHGGGFVYGDLDSHDAACRFLTRRAGVRVLAVDYRLAPEHTFPAAHDDCVAAYRWVVEHVAELGADADRLAVGGDSAGGCLAATTAIAAAREGLPLAFQLLVYPVTDLRGDTESRRTFAAGFYLTEEFSDLAERCYLNSPADRTDPRASPLLADLPAGLAPAYVATAGFDPLRDEGEAYAARLEEAGVPTEVRRFEDQIHSFFNVVGVGRSARAANEEIAAALRTGLTTAAERSPG
ncbi:alpha/beta hydrolase [Nocardioides coralli]|uniref:alpha/beta hydrolase n=1 Tax=Nocardioides coralli TaxID=2872154 RepID=UPI00201740B7|nr:alpha/beta hydrolase [Nocardioides coralli]